MARYSINSVKTLAGFGRSSSRERSSAVAGSHPDVRCLFNHNPDAVLGRTKAGTLRLSEDRTGLYFDCDLPDTQAGRDVRESVTRGDVDQCSFGFVVQGQNWREEKDGGGGTQAIRELTDVDLFDVSPVTYPAYPQTSVSARLLWPEGEPAEVRKRLSTARSVTIPPKTSPASAAIQEPPASSKRDGWTDAERLAEINQRLGVPVFKSKMVRSNQTMNSNHSPMSVKDTAELRRFLTTGKHEQRDLTTGGTAAAFVPETFNAMVFAGMRAYDAIFDPAFSTPLETDTAGPLDLFAIDDTQAAASVVAESFADTESDPNNLFKVTLAQAPTWDSGLIKASLAFVQDSGPNLPELLAQSLAVRLARGIAPSLVTALVGAASLGATATGDQNSAAPSGATQIGYQDVSTGLKGATFNGFEGEPGVTGFGSRGHNGMNPGGHRQSPQPSFFPAFSSYAIRITFLRRQQEQER